MKKHYVFRQKMWLYAIVIATIIVLLTFSIVNILRLCNVGSMVSYNHTLDTFAVIIMIFVSIALFLITFLSGYTLCNTYLLINVGLAFEKIKYEDILLLRTNSQNNILLLYFKSQNGQIKDSDNEISANLIQVNINSKHINGIIDQLKQKNNEILVEILPEENIDSKAK